MARGYSVKKGSRDMPPPPGISAWMRAASSVVVRDVPSGLNVDDASG